MKRNLWIGLVVLTLACFWAAWAGQLWWWQAHGIDVLQPEVMGQWGDTFGALNALLSTFAFSAVLVTIWMQQQQINDARREQHIQRFESSFLQLLDLIRMLRENVQYQQDGGGGTAHVRLEGLAAFSGALKPLHLQFGLLRETDRPYVEPQRALTDWYSLEILPKSQNGLGPYFRVIYNMLDRLRRDQVLSDKEKVEYSRLLRGQLNDDEVILMGINGLSHISKDFSSLIVQFRMLKYAPQGPIRNVLEQCYAKEAFARRRGNDARSDTPS